MIYISLRTKYKKLKGDNLYTILMFGTGNLSSIIENLLNDKVNILAYVDNDHNKWNSKKNDKYIISPDKIANYDYDYIIIASQFNEEIYTQLLLMNIDKRKIFQYSKFMDNYWNYCKEYINVFKSHLDGFFEVLVTGISYALFGFSEKKCIKRTLKFAFSSQDLFYDYNIIKYLIKNYKYEMSNVKAVIIGLSYYSFQYDMSLSAMKSKTVMYYEVLKDSHHFKEIQRVYEEYDINKSIGDKLLRKNKDGKYDIQDMEDEKINVFENMELIGKQQAKRDCNKNYPNTVKENVEIFEAYLNLLMDNDIKPIVVVFPATKYYTSHFSERIEQEFKNIIEKVQKKYDFQYIDYFRSSLFKDDDFKDVSHLNKTGAIKFTQILNKIINW
ncbi:chemotaxis protein [Clostridium sp. LS]|uniref:chemotaxis protein n=1 Tax=Clostridium sp. LS TaxID=1352601 RepID=UPI001FA8DF25|nr:chemotaxis protein [Clostridium sp. LS]